MIVNYADDAADISEDGFYDEDREEEGDNKKIPSHDTSLLLPYITDCTYFCGILYGRYVTFMLKLLSSVFVHFDLHILFDDTW